MKSRIVTLVHLSQFIRPTPLWLAVLIAGSWGSFVQRGYAGWSSAEWVTNGFSAQTVTTLAVIVPQEKGLLAASGVSAPTMSAIEQEFTKAGMAKGYELAVRLQVPEILKEIDFQNSGATKPEKAAALGKMLNASHLLILSPHAAGVRTKWKDAFTGKLVNGYSYQARIVCQWVEVSTGKQVATCSEKGDLGQATSPQEGTDLIVRLARKIAKAMPPKAKSAK